MNLILTTENTENAQRTQRKIGKLKASAVSYVWVRNGTKAKEKHPSPKFSYRVDTSTSFLQINAS